MFCFRYVHCTVWGNREEHSTSRCKTYDVISSWCKKESGGFRLSLWRHCRVFQWSIQGFVIKGINHTGQIFLTRPSVSSCVRHGCNPLERFFQRVGTSEWAVPEFIDPGFRENKPKTLVFSHWKRAVWACFHENWVYNFGHWYMVKYLRISSYIRKPFLINDLATDPI